MPPPQQQGQGGQQQQGQVPEQSAGEKFSEWYYGIPVVARNMMVILLITAILAGFQVIPAHMLVYCPSEVAIQPLNVIIPFFLSSTMCLGALDLVVSMAVTYFVVASFEKEEGSVLTVYWASAFHFSLQTLFALLVVVVKVFSVFLGARYDPTMSFCVNGPIPLLFAFGQLACMRSTQPHRSFCGMNIPTKLYPLFLLAISELLNGMSMSRAGARGIGVAIGYLYYTHYYDRITPDRERVLAYERHPRLGFMTSARNFLTYDQAQSGYTMVAGTGPRAGAGADGGAGRATGSSGGVFRTGSGPPGARGSGSGSGGGGGSGSGGGGGGGGDGVKVGGGTTIFGGTGHKLGTSSSGAGAGSGSSSVQMQPVPMHVVQLPHRDTPRANQGGDDSNV